MPEGIYANVTDGGAAQSGQEPVSGLQGKGTVTEPFDQGNAEDPVRTGEEPPSGIQGKGTTTEPYDGGNAPGEHPLPPPIPLRVPLIRCLCSRKPNRPSFYYHLER